MLAVNVIRGEKIKVERLEDSGEDAMWQGRSFSESIHNEGD